MHRPLPSPRLPACADGRDRVLAAAREPPNLPPATADVTTRALPAGPLRPLVNGGRGPSWPPPLALQLCQKIRKRSGPCSPGHAAPFRAQKRAVGPRCGGGIGGPHRCAQLHRPPQEQSYKGCGLRMLAIQPLPAPPAPLVSNSIWHPAGPPSHVPALLQRGVGLDYRHGTGRDPGCPGQHWRCPQATAAERAATQRPLGPPPRPDPIHLGVPGTRPRIPRTLHTLQRRAGAVQRSGPRLCVFEPRQQDSRPATSGWQAPRCARAQPFARALRLPASSTPAAALNLLLQPARLH